MVLIVSSVVLIVLCFCFEFLCRPYVRFPISSKVRVIEWPPFGKKAAYSAYDMFP